jgi:hypothetical protein
MTQIVAYAGCALVQQTVARQGHDVPELCFLLYMAMNNMAMNKTVRPISVIARIPRLVVEYHVYRAPVKCLSSIFE